MCFGCYRCTEADIFFDSDVTVTFSNRLTPISHDFNGQMDKTDCLIPLHAFTCGVIIRVQCLVIIHQGLEAWKDTLSIDKFIDDVQVGVVSINFVAMEMSSSFTNNFDTPSNPNLKYKFHVFLLILLKS